MAKLRKFTLSNDKKIGDWVLKHDVSHRVKKRFDSKEKALTGGVLDKILGTEGGSVKIKKLDGRIQEERTYGKGRDPKRSRG
jgi:hypothetical protein